MKAGCASLSRLTALNVMASWRFFIVENLRVKGEGVNIQKIYGILVG
jgi:hypothetical protein